MSISNTFKNLSDLNLDSLNLGDLNDFTPKPASSPPAASVAAAPSPQQLERLAAEQGFTLDNHPIARRALKSGRVASKDRAQPMTLRIRVADWNRFSAFCERNGHTVAEGFERLAALTDKL